MFNKTVKKYEESFLRQRNLVIKRMLSGILSLADAFQIEKDEQFWDNFLNIKTNKNNLDSTGLFFNDGFSNFSYDPTPYSVIGNLMNHLPKGKNISMLEAGGGPGRISISFATKDFNNITSVEINPYLTNIGKENAKKIQHISLITPINFITEDILFYSSPQNMFLDQFNSIIFARPFDRKKTEQFSLNLKLSLKNNPRSLFFTYIAPAYKEIFDWLSLRKSLNQGEMPALIYLYEPN